MQARQAVFLAAAGLVLTLGLGISVSALADDSRQRASARSYSSPAQLSYGKYRGYQRSAHSRRARHSGRGHYRLKSGHYARSYPRGYHRVYRYPRHYGHARYYGHRHYRHHRRDINLGAVVAGVVLGGLIYEVLDDDSSDDYETDIEHYYDD